MARILNDDWSSRLGENRPERALNHLAAMHNIIIFDQHLALMSYFMSIQLDRTLDRIEVRGLWGWRRCVHRKAM